MNYSTSVTAIDPPLLAGPGQLTKANNINIWLETFGEKENPAVLLIMGGSCQGILWPKIFCEKLANEGFYVIRYDHRDMGFSSCFDFAEKPYDVMDMAKDAVGLLDSIGVKKAHLFGVSLGAFLAELMAVYFSERVHSILVIGSTCDIRPMNRAYADLPIEENAILSPPAPYYLAWRKECIQFPPQTTEEKLARRMEGWNRANGQIVALNEKINQEIHKEFLSRLRYPQGMHNHFMLLQHESTETLVQTTPSKIKIPTVILHGSEDPVFPPDHGEALRQAIKNSEYFLIEGMGHIPNDHFYDFYIDILKRQASIL